MEIKKEQKELTKEYLEQRHIVDGLSMKEISEESGYFLK